MEQEIISGIYCITNKINNKKYIGQSKNIYKRWKQHKNKIKSNDNNYLYNAIRLYGLENFSFEIIEECSIDELNEREIYYINYFDSYNNGYNSTYGGDGSSGFFAKINPNILQDIINDLQNSSLSQNEIAEKYEVNFTTISGINHGDYHYNPNLSYPIRDNSANKIYCMDCGIEIGYGNIRCQSCYGKSIRKVKRPEKEELKNLIRNFSFLKIGKDFGISDNAIRKWCREYNLPYTKKDIKQYTDEQWCKL